MLNKRGQQEPLAARSITEIIISVIAVVLLVALLVALLSVVFNSLKSADKEKAKSLLAEISDTLEWMEQQGKDSSDVLVNNPKEWYIFVYNAGEAMPEKCLTKVCICICPAGDIGSCQNNGVCKNPVLNSITKLSAYDFNINSQALFKDDISLLNGVFIQKAPSVILFSKTGSEIRFFNQENKYPAQGEASFINFLTYSSPFTDSRTMSIKDQIIEYAKDGKWKGTSFGALAEVEYTDLNKEKGNLILKNAEAYFKDYPYSIRVQILAINKEKEITTVILTDTFGKDALYPNTKKNEVIYSGYIGESNSNKLFLRILSVK